MKTKIIALIVGSFFIALPSYSAQPKKGAIKAKSRTSLSEQKNTEENKEESPQITTEQANALIEKAQAGDAEAQFQLGELIYKGIYFKEDKAKAVKWWVESSKRKNAQAAAMLGYCYRHGYGVEKPDSLDAIRLYLAAFRLGDKKTLSEIESASEKDAFSAVVAGQAYRDGAGVKKNLDKAIFYYHAAAKLGSGDVIYPLAEMTYRVKDYPAAIKWFKQAANLKGLPEKQKLAASYWYGKLLIDGASGTPEPDAGFPYVLHAAEKGLVGAQMQTARCYWDGLGTEVDAKKGFEWMLEASKQGNAEAEWLTAMAILDQKGTDLSFPYAFMWMSCSANHSSINRFKKWIEDKEVQQKYANYLLWMKGINGVGKEQFEEVLQIAKEFKKAKLNDYATYFESIVLISPNYKKVNQKKGLTNLEKLAATNAYTKYELVKIALSGIVKDYAPNTIEMLEQCIEAGLYTAYEELGNIYFDGRGVDKNITKALVNYKKAKECSMLSAAGYKRLASCYENGWGVDKNPQRAKDLLKDAPKNLANQMLELVP